MSRWNPTLSLELFETSCSISLFPSHLECIFFLTWFCFLSFLSFHPFCCVPVHRAVSASQWPWRQTHDVKGGRAAVVIPQLSCYRRSGYSDNANHQQSFALKLCLFILLKDHPKSCLEMLNNAVITQSFLNYFSSVSNFSQMPFISEWNGIGTDDRSLSY